MVQLDFLIFIGLIVFVLLIITHLTGTNGNRKARNVDNTPASYSEPNVYTNKPILSNHASERMGERLGRYRV